MFVGLDNLEALVLDNNTISTIEAGAFVNLPALRTLDLSHNNINTFPIEALSNLNTSALSDLSMNGNQMETLPPMAYDILASIRTVYITNNPWQCDCRMLPFKQKMTGSYPFESQIACAGPANLTGKSLLRDANPEDLNCEETTTEIYSTPSTSSPVGQSTSTPSTTNFLFESSTTVTPSTTDVHSPSFPTTTLSTTDLPSVFSPTTPSSTNFNLESSPTTTDISTHSHSSSSPIDTPSTEQFDLESSTTAAPSPTHFHSPSSQATTSDTTNSHLEFSPTRTPRTTQSRVTEGSSTSLGSFSLSAFLSGLLGGVVGSLLTSAILLAIRCIKTRAKTSPAPVPQSSDVRSNTDDAPTKGYYHSGHGASAARAADPASDDVESLAGGSGTVPLPYSFDQSSAVLRPPVPPIKGAGSQTGYQNLPAETDAANSCEPLKNHFIYQQTCPSGLPKGLAGL